MNRYGLALFLTVFLLSITCSMAGPSCPENIPDKSGSKKKESNQNKNEFRAVWIATINNIDWPSRSNLTVEEQQQEFLSLLDTFQKFNLNVAILQVRAASDAFYQSKSEPWSVFLTGKQGKAPAPYYDPLRWAIEACHKRGMELHAWFNPFRVRNIGYYPLDPGNFAAKNPRFAVAYDKKMYLDPGYPEVRKHVVGVIAEVAHNYDVDAILLDDYFYPYPVAGEKFGDEKSFARYGGEFFPKKIRAWRRDNIDQFIASLHDTLQMINPHMKFGISPFGIWRNKSNDPEGSPGVRGLSAYDDLFSDVRKWLMNDWIDFVIPQLYWEKGNRFGDFTSLLQWWSQISYGKNLYIGQALYKHTSPKYGWNRPDELAEQINLLRTNNKVGGFAFFSASNMEALSTGLVKNLCEKQLQGNVNDDRQAVETSSSQTIPVPADTLRLTRNEELMVGRFIYSLDSRPLSIREIWKHPSGIVPIIVRGKGNICLQLKLPESVHPQLYALVSFKKTGNRKYIQNVMDIAGSPQFVFTESAWDAMAKMEFVVVSLDLQTNLEYYTGFFSVNRKRVRERQNPFKHF